MKIWLLVLFVSMMASTKYDIEKFTGSNDFGLWRIKMRSILVQQSLIKALGGESKLSPTLSEEENEDLLDKAHSAVLLSLGDKVLRQVSKEKSAAAVWAKLESLYMTKSLVNRLTLKQALYSFRMTENKSVQEQLDVFNKLIQDLENIDVEISDEDQALMLLCSLPNSYDSFKDTLLYGRDSLSMEDVQSALSARELKEKNSEPSNSGGGLFIRSGQT